MSATVLRLFVPGRPRTKGSLKPIHRRGTAGRPCHIGLTEDHALSKPWMRKMTRAMVTSRRLLPPCVEPVEVNAFFRFEQELSTAAATLGVVWPSHDTPYPTDDKIGDEDKLRRSVLDALTQSHTIKDDALVVGGDNWKRWVVMGEESGVTIVVRLAPEPADVVMLEKALWTAAGEVGRV